MINKYIDRPGGNSRDFSQYRIGQIFTYEGKFYKVKEDDTVGGGEICSGCAFRKVPCHLFCCSKHERAEGKSVLFVECDEAGMEIPLRKTFETIRNDE